MNNCFLCVLYNMFIVQKSEITNNQTEENKSNLEIPI